VWTPFQKKMLQSRLQMLQAMQQLLQHDLLLLMPASWRLIAAASVL